MADPRKELADEGLTSAEAEAVIRRALEIQARVQGRQSEMDRASLEAGAEAAGVSREFIRQALSELRAEAAAREAARAARRRTVRWVVGSVVVIVLLVTFTSHRALTARLVEVEARRAQLENVLQRRHDLIPTLM
ncbi:MAG: hypothetical protein QHJ73_17975, partial [Armatimonadota bacterium]|nr:hypothetical protein [Armatimonadota bacterium]